MTPLHTYLPSKATSDPLAPDIFHQPFLLFTSWCWSVKVTIASSPEPLSLTLGLAFGFFILYIYWHSNGCLISTVWILISWSTSFYWNISQWGLKLCLYYNIHLVPRNSSRKKVLIPIKILYGFQAVCYRHCWLAFCTAQYSSPLTPSQVLALLAILHPMTEVARAFIWQEELFPIISL